MSPKRMQRVSVVGISGSGKSTIARRLARILGCERHELDAIYWQTGWEPLDGTDFRRRLDEITSRESWVIDGSYQDWTVDGPIWERADTVVWARLPKWLTMRQVLTRSLGRIFRREKLWNDNRETLRRLLHPRDSILVDVWRRFDGYNRDFERFVQDPRFAHITFFVLTSHAEIAAWLDSVQRSSTHEAAPAPRDDSRSAYP